MFYDFFIHALDPINDRTDFNVHSIRKVAAEISEKALGFKWYYDTIEPKILTIAPTIYTDSSNKFSVLSEIDE